MASLLVATAAASDVAAGDKEALDALVAAYPEALARHDGEFIYWRDGTRMRAKDDTPDKSFDDALRHASILDQFRLPYPRGRIAAAPELNADPGRFRNEAFFLRMHGDCGKRDFARQIVSVRWLPKSWGKTILVTRVNGVAERLRRISAEIDALPPDIRRAAYPATALACRAVRDTGARSMHAYGAAIDLDPDRAGYWLTHGLAAGSAYRARMPQQIVDIFERHGFIWGGKWYHYDTMHFEYRPELLRYSE